MRSYCTIKSKQTKNLESKLGLQYKVRKQVVSYLAKKLLATHSTSSISCYLFLFMQTQFQLGSYIHTCTNETYSLANVQDLIPSLAAIIIGSTN